MNEKFIEYRKKYKEFIYEKYDIMEDNEIITLSFHFIIPGLTEFNPKIEILKKNIKYKDINTEFVKNMVFNIGMIELISYWKCVCPPKVIIKCGYLNQEQIKWFKKLYYNGIGEYRYINNITVLEADFMDIEITQDYKKIELIDEEELNGTIIPIGGGKDSIVTLELLKETKKDNYCLLIGGKEPSIQSAKIAGFPDDKIIEVKRTIDKSLIQLNKKGFLNGHTPFSSLLAFLSYLIAFLTNKKYIALSNESSANETNVNGENINHQYSKSYEFEQDFEYYSNSYLRGKVKYFSILRPLNELQIAKLFALNTKYHKIFRSCNVGSKEIPWKWCGKCPKCLFVFIILSPFLYKDNLVDIFEQDLYKNKNLIETFKELCGYGKTKPFECVGTYEEVNYAISITIKKLEEEKAELPYLLKYYKDNYKLIDTKEDITKRYNEQNNLPKHLNNMLKGKILND